MRHSVIDRAARLLLLGALSVGAIKTLPAQTIADVPADVLVNTTQVDNIYRFNASGLYRANNTGNARTNTGAFSDKLALGSDTILLLTGSGAQAGLLVEDDFLVDGGLLRASAIGYYHDSRTGIQACSVGLHMADGDFRLEDGMILALGENGGDGIVVKQGDFIVENGVLMASGVESTFEADSNGFRIMIRDRVMTFTGQGTEYYGCGVVVDNGNLVIDGGEVYAYAENGGCGIMIDQGNLEFGGGMLVLESGGQNGVASVVVGGDTNIAADTLFSSRINPLLDDWGTMMVAGDVTIKDGATFDLAIHGSVALEKGDENAVTKTFLTIDKPYDDVGPSGPATGTIMGEFTALGTETLTLSYGLQKSDGSESYSFTSSRKAYASEVMNGNNAALARSIERNYHRLDFDTHREIFDLYTRMDVAGTLGEMNTLARSQTPWQATQFGLIGLGLIDTTQSDMSRNFGLLRRVRPLCDPCDEVDVDCDTGCQTDDPRHLWFAAHGRFSHFGAKTGSFAGLDVDSYGMNVGMARQLKRFGRNTACGIAFNYTHGNIDGGNSDSEYDYYGFLASVRTDLRRIRGWGELSFGYSRAEFDQGRYDVNDYLHDSSVDNDLVRLGLTLGRDFRWKESRRLTPIAALEYTHVHQDGYTEASNNPMLDLRVGGDDMNSLRLRFGGEMEFLRKKSSLVLYGFFRYEMLDRDMTLDTRFDRTPILRFDTRGQSYNRSSGVLGAKWNRQLSKRSNLGLAYDLTLGDKQTEHWIDLVYRRAW